MFFQKYISIILALLFICYSTEAQLNRMFTGKGISAYGNYVQRVSGNCAAYHSFDIRNGQLWAWGNNEFGQLGDGTAINKSIAVRIGTAEDWVQVAAAYSHSVGIRSDGSLWAWGFPDWSGSPGPAYDQPTRIGTDQNWVSITTGDSHTLALKSDGTLWAWGWNESGQLGIGNTTNQSSPVQLGSDHNWTAIASGNEHNLALKADGTLWAWGLNSDGQLGTGNTTNQLVPVQVGSTVNWTHISCGRSSLAIQSNGTLWTWGEINASNQPVQTGTANTWIAVSSGGENYGLRSDGTLWTLSNNSSTQFGNADDWIRISACGTHNLAIKATGSLWAWGSNDFGQLGNGTTNSQPAPVQTGVLNEIVMVAAGQEHGYLLRSNGSLWSWGSNDFGQLGTGNNIHQTSPIQAGTSNLWVNVSASAYSAAAIRSDGTLWTWGLNLYGQLGDGTTTNRNNAVQVGTGRNWVSVRVGDSHCLGLKSDGTLWAWGRGSSGQLGTGNFQQQSTPVQIGSAQDWVSVAAGTNHSLALKADGSLWGWGWNVNGEIGDGTTTMRNAPVRCGTANDWIAISAGGLFSLGLKADGTTWAWGNGSDGQLGNGLQGSSASPQVIPGLVQVIQLRAGFDYSTAVKADGSLWGWGQNADGQLGTGNNSSILSPQRAGTESNWVQAEPAFSHSLALRATRSQHCATGTNTRGQLGNGSTSNLNEYNCGPFTGCVSPPAPAAGQPVSVCSGQGALLTVTGTGTIGWYDAPIGGNWLGGGSTFTTGPITSTTAYYAQDSTCAASVVRTMLTVTIRSSVPPPAPGVFTQYICSGESATLTGYGSLNGTISWYDAPSGGNWLGSGPLYNTPPLTATGTLSEYFFYAQDSLCVASATRTAGIVVVYPRTIPQFSSIPPFCQGTIAPVLPLLSDNGIAGTWFPSTVSNQSSGTYTFTPAPGLDCGNTVTMDITVLPAPPAAIINQSGTTALGCGLSTILVSATGGISYSWDGGLGNNANAGISLPGTYTVTVTGANGCVSTAETTITQNNGVPGPTSITGLVNVCSYVGTASTLTYIASSDGAISYNWVVPPNVAIESGQGTANLNVRFLPGFITQANKQIRVTASNNCGSNAQVVFYLSASFPGTPHPILASTKDICPGIGTNVPVTYSIPKVPGASSYNWITQAGTTTIDHLNGTGENDTTVTVIFSQAFTSSPITVQAVNPCGVSGVRSLMIYRLNPRTPGLISGPVNTCIYLPSPAFPSGQPAIYSVANVPEAVSYTWTVPAGATIVNHTNNGSEDIITVQFAQYTSGTISVYTSNGCGSSGIRTRSLSRLNPSAPLAIEGPDDACGYLASGLFTAHYSIPEISNAVAYEWNLPTGSVNITGQGTRNISFRFPDSFSGGEISVKGINGCGTSSIRKKFISRHNPSGPVSVTATLMQACPDRIFKYSIGSSAPYTTGYQWTVPPSGIILSGQGTEEIQVAYPSTEITGMVSVRGENSCGLSNPFELNVNLPSCSGAFSILNIKGNNKTEKQNPFFHQFPYSSIKYAFVTAYSNRTQNHLAKSR